MKRTLALVGVAVLSAGLVGCSTEDVTGPADSEAALLDVAPRGGSMNVDLASTITIRFSHSMNPAMSEYADVHEGDLTGPIVAGTWTWSADNTTLTFTPSERFKPATTYAIHLGGGMRDADDHPVDFGQHGPGMGGQWATGEMMGGGPMDGSMGGSGPHAGGGWQHPTNGSYGMVFTFTTAS